MSLKRRNLNEEPELTEGSCCLGGSFKARFIQDYTGRVHFSWRVNSLSWLILADREHFVNREGFALSELYQKSKIDCQGDK